MGNVTRTPLNETDRNSSGRPSGGGGGSNRISDPVPPFRMSQEFTAVAVQVSFSSFIMASALAINIMMIVVLHKKFKTIPYLMLLNIVAVDLVTGLLNGPLFILGVMLDHLGLLLQNICNVQGFFHAAFCTIFLNTVTMVAMSRCLAVLKPHLYHKIFANKIVIRLLSLCVWSTSALLCVPPLNHKGWGAYKRFEATCWLAWLPDNPDYVAYNSLITILSLGTAVASCIIGFYVAYASRQVGAAPPTQAPPPPPPPPPYAGAMNMTEPIPDKTVPHKVRLNTEVLLIVGVQFLVYIVLWVPLTVMNSIHLKDWRDIEFRVITTFLFLFLGRSIINPILCLVLSADIRKEFFNVIFKCQCRWKENHPNDIEM